MLVNAFAKDFEYFSENVGILFSLGIEKEPMSCEFLTTSLALRFDYYDFCFVQ